MNMGRLTPWWVPPSCALHDGLITTRSPPPPLPLPSPHHPVSPQARDPGLAVTQVTNAMRFLPPEAVLAFNIGNEADSYM